MNLSEFEKSGVPRSLCDCMQFVNFIDGPEIHIDASRYQINSDITKYLNIISSGATQIKINYPIGGSNPAGTHYHHDSSHLYYAPVELAHEQSWRGALARASLLAGFPRAFMVTSNDLAKSQWVKFSHGSIFVSSVNSTAHVISHHMTLCNTFKENNTLLQISLNADEIERWRVKLLNK